MSQMLGNPCADSEAVDGIPDMVLKVSNEASCSTTAPATSALQVEQGNHACFYLDREDSEVDVGGRTLTATWDLRDSAGAALTLIGQTQHDVLGWSLGNSILIPDDDSMSGETLTLHVDFEQSRSSGGAYRRLRAVYKLGAKDAGDADASFTVLPAHISVLDAAEDAPADAPAKATPAEDARTADIVTYLSGSVIGIAALVWLGQQAAKFIGGSTRKLEEAGYAPISRFTSATKY